jgi:hypothetical protein
MRKFLAFLAVVTLALLAVAPIALGIALVARHDYALAAVPLLYFLPYALIVLLGINPLRKLLRIAKGDGLDAMRGHVAHWIERLKREAPTEEERADSAAGLWHLLSSGMLVLKSIFAIPMIFLKAMLGAWLGMRVAMWPDFEPAWLAMFIALAYLLGKAHPVVALVMSSYLLFIKLYDVVSNFETQHGTLKMISYRKYQVGLSDIVVAAMSMAASWGCVHYSVSVLAPNAYSQPLMAIDGLYFSVITFATVGYGDIYPRAVVSKLLCIGEIVSGYLVLVFGVNVAIAVWLQKFANANPGAENRSQETASTADKPLG